MKWKIRFHARHETITNNSSLTPKPTLEDSTIPLSISERYGMSNFYQEIWPLQKSELLTYLCVTSIEYHSSSLYSIWKYNVSSFGSPHVELDVSELWLVEHRSSFNELLHFSCSISLHNFSIQILLCYQRKACSWTIFWSYRCNSLGKTCLPGFHCPNLDNFRSNKNYRFL